jgi:spore germination cell wall hydrolase CwlJ-like protein
MLNELAAISAEITEKEEQLLEDQKYLSSLQKDLDKKIDAASDELTDYKAKLKKAKEVAERLEEEAKKEVKPVVPEKEDSDNGSDKESNNSSGGPLISATASDVELLAALLECEAGTSNYEALLAVGSVVVNRMKSRHYPDTVRGVIYQSGQFPPAHDGKVDRVLKRGVKDLCLTAAQDALAGKNNVGGCLSFRASSSGREGLIIGDNVFF